MKQKETDQLNFSATPIKTIDRFKEFAHKFRMKRNRKASDSAIGAMVLEIGLDACEKELEESNKSDQ